MSTPDEPEDGYAISYKVLERGTPVCDRDGASVGSVRQVLENEAEHIFDGLVIDTPGGMRFVDAPEVARIAERRVTLTITAAEAAGLPDHEGMRATIGTSARRASRRWRRRLGL
jgi:Mrp family chromosome partitioning ATPase